MILRTLASNSPDQTLVFNRIPVHGGHAEAVKLCVNRLSSSVALEILIITALPVFSHPARTRTAEEAVYEA